MKSQCDNCGWVGLPKISAFADIPNLFERIDPGGVVPSGECPECGALCYPRKPKPKHVAHVVNVQGEGWQVKIPSGKKNVGTWFTVCDCYHNPMTGNAEETAIKIAQILNGN